MLAFSLQWLVGCFYVVSVSGICTELMDMTVFKSVTTEFIVYLDEDLNCEIYLKLKWEIEEGIRCDGYLYSQSPYIQDEREEFNDTASYSGFTPLPRESTHTCKDLLNKNPIEMNPKEDFDLLCDGSCLDCGPDAFGFSFCNEIFWHDLLSKDTKEVETKANFGVEYNFELRAYSNFSISKSATSGSVVIFCLDEMIGRQKMNISLAKQICKKYPVSGDFATGPVSNFYLSRIDHNWTENTAIATFSWSQPYDIAQGTFISWYMVSNDGGDQISHFSQKIHAKSMMPIGKSSQYEVQVMDLAYDIEHEFAIEPFCDTCVGQKSGARARILYSIPGLDTCNASNLFGYCDVNARCRDSVGQNVPASCECFPGYSGDGINPVHGGIGCIVSCSPQKAGNETCDVIAKCVRDDHIVTCSCPEYGYFGDGYENGSGCVHVVAIAGPAGLLALALTSLLICRRYKHIKLERKKRSSRYYASIFPEPSNLKVECGDVGKFGQSWELDRGAIALQEVIGRGTFGLVQKAVLRKTGDGGTNETVAVKTVSGVMGDQAKSEFLSEIALIISIGRHENILKIVGCCTAGSLPVMLVTEFMKYGDLLHFLVDAREFKKSLEDPIYKLTELEVYMIGRQVANGMGHLRRLQIIHGDLAARNILVGEGLICKISDFGLANDVYRYGMINGAVEKRVPYKWISPERMMGGKVPVTWRSDVWSYGILLHEIITLGASPFPGIKKEELFERLRTGYRMGKALCCSVYLYNIMCKCWQWTPSARPTFKKLEELMTYDNKNRKYVNLADALYRKEQRCARTNRRLNYSEI